MTVRPCMLFSYFYFRTRDLDQILGHLAVRPRLFADSGAFSAHAYGSDIDLASYIGWLHRWEDWFEVAAALDVIGDPKASERNWRTMKADGLDVIPVWHLGEPFELFETYCADSDYVAIGGMASERWGTDVTMHHLVECFLHAQTTGTALHGFGQTRLNIMSDLPWYSVDSTSWQSGFLFGAVRLWDPARRELKILQLGDWDEAWQHADLIRSYGLDVEMIAARKDYHHAKLLPSMVLSYHRLQGWLRERHGSQLRPGRDPGLHLYLAVTQIAPTMQIIETIENEAA